jgi:hypothetical protein
MKPDDAPAEPASQANAPLTRRRFLRVLVDLPGQYAIADRPHWERCSIVNIGAGGVRLQTLAIIAGGTGVSIRFEFDGTPLVLKARVVDSKFDRPHGSFFSSAAFTSMDAEQQQKIERRVDELWAAAQSHP